MVCLINIFAQVIMSQFLSTNPDDLARVLQDEKRNIEEREAQGKAGRVGLEYVNLLNFPMDLTALGVFSEQEARDLGAVPFYKDKHDLRVGTNNPDNSALKEKLNQIASDFNVKLYYISKSSYDATLRFYSKVLRPTSQFQDMIQFKTSEGAGNAFSSKKLQELLDGAKTSASDMLNAIFASAVE